MLLHQKVDQKKKGNKKGKMCFWGACGKGGIWADYGEEIIIWVGGTGDSLKMLRN